MNYHLDQSGVELIASFEGFVDGVYNDSRGLATCGYGHLLHMSPATAADHRTYDGKGRAFFEHLLHDDIQRVSISAMDAALHVPLNANRVRAVASATFNCGAGFVSGTVGRLINERKWQAAADAFMLWAHPSVLIPRREQERALFMRPVKGAGNSVHLPWCLPDERSWCLEYDRLHKANRNVRRRRELREKMHRRAIDIRVAAQREGRHGWEHAHRRQRFHSLNARSS